MNPIDQPGTPIGGVIDLWRLPTRQGAPISIGPVASTAFGAATSFLGVEPGCSATPAAVSNSRTCVRARSSSSRRPHALLPGAGPAPVALRFRSARPDAPMACATPPRRTPCNSRTCGRCCARTAPGSCSASGARRGASGLHPAGHRLVRSLRARAARHSPRLGWSNIRTTPAPGTPPRPGHRRPSQYRCVSQTSS